MTDGYDAVLIAVGAHEGIRLPIPGADLDGVLINTHFLRDVRVASAGLEQCNENGRRLRDMENEFHNRRVVVLGGGNVALDCARTAVRLGSKCRWPAWRNGRK